MTNTFYNPTGNPATGSDGLSSLMRSEFALIGAAFDVQPQITTTGVFATVLNQQGNLTFTLPAATGTFALLSDVASEATARATADTAGTTALAAEATARAAGDAAEATARVAANALLAPKDSPTFTTSATLSYTLATLDNSNKAVSSSWVANFLAASGFAPAGASPVITVASRTGNVILTHTDITDWTATLAPYAPISSVPPLLRGYLGDLGLSNDGVSPLLVLDIAAGTCTDSTNTTTITLGAFTKSIGGAWTAGSGNNAMGIGLTATANTWYHVFAAIVSGIADVFFDTSPTAANKPASTTAFRRIGSIKLDASVHILPFSQFVDEFLWTTPILDANAVPGSTAANGVVLSVPVGVVVKALFRADMADATNPSAVLFSSPAVADLAPNILTGAGISLFAPSASSAFGSAGDFAVRTDTLGQIRYRVSAITTAFRIHTYGWIDTRGRT